jgi:L-amino acid ligase C-terminal domain 2
LPIPRAGVLRAVDGVDAARAVPGVTGLEITVPRGRAVVPLPEGDRYLGFVFARGAAPADVEGSLRAAHASLEIDIS